MASPIEVDIQHWQEEPNHEQQALAEFRVLVVDDNEGVRNFAKDIFPLYVQGAQIETAASVDEALERITSSKKPFDVMVTDFSLAKKNGVGLAGEAILLMPWLTVFVFTGEADVVRTCYSPEELQKNHIAGIYQKGRSIRELYGQINGVMIAKMQQQRVLPSQP